MVSFVIPVYNEEENINLLYSNLFRVINVEKLSYEILFVNDGSTDKTGLILKEIAKTDTNVKVIFLSRNFGHQAALSCGLKIAMGDCVIMMDGDMQDPPEIIPQFLDRWRQGNEVVFSIKTKRSAGIPKKIAYNIFYKLLGLISNLDIPLDSGDFCLMDRKVVNVINNEMPEQIRFVRGLRTFSGFRQTGINYDRPARAYGKPKYTFTKLMKLALDGLLDFSTFPLRIATYLGIMISIPSFLIGMFFVAHRVIGFQFLGHTAEETPGLASLAVGMFFLGGVMLLILGIIGEYIGRIYYEVKKRPFYIIDKIYPENKKEP